MFNKHLLQFLWIPVCGLLTLLCLLLTVLGAVSGPTSALEVREEIHISSSPKTGAEVPVYICQLTGELFNPTGKDVALDTLKVSMQGDEGSEYVLYLTDLVVPARRALVLEATWESAAPYDRVTGLRAVNAERTDEEIRTDEGLSPTVLLFGILTLLSLLATLHFVRQRVYIAEEEKALCKAADAE